MVFTILSIVLPFVALAAGVFWDGRSDDNPDGASFAPGLALDLQGGTQVILTPTSTDGSEITPEAIEESINVIRQRIDSSGVTEAEIAAQGNNVVVGIPGEASQETIDLVSQPAQMRFRPVLTYDLGVPAQQQPTDGAGEAPAEGEDAAGEPSAEPSDAASPDTSPNGRSRGEAVTAPKTASTDGSADEAATDEASQEPAEESTPAPSEEPAAPAPTEAADPSDPAQITPELQEQFAALDCSLPENRVGGGGDDPNAPLVTCSQDGSLKWILGPVEVDGTHLTNASSGLRVTAQGVTTNEWAVNMEFDGEGTRLFRETTTRLQALESPRNQFAIVLDGLVVSAPSLSPGTIIADGRAEISGSFTRESAATLANQLSFGALPIAFEVQSQEQISATLGSEQLRNGLVAGLIGLALVVVYSLFQYRSLGLLTVASLVWAGLITYVAIALLSWLMGYRLSLAGVAGLIVAIGFTADSFIVYFERIRDEMRDGRSLAMAVERGWRRARRTILAAKSVTLISAIILYFLAVGGVQGFAFTLGLTTVIDVAVVFWFTHPAMQLIAKIPFFRDGHSWSGLSPERLRASGVRYVGAGRVAVPATAAAAAEPAAPDESELALAGATTAAVPSSARSASSPAAPASSGGSGRRMTIAERRAAERKAAAAAAAQDPGGTTVEDTQHADRGENEESR
ncbi:preprotein translocase subunit SecD [Isoptericola variabilis J7]|uniref:Protein translocase subunit SecD n=1 Tax=Isoptericola variabilis (strain 225) TaxID=743718 RepID=F6FVH6_ISOV2|nr:protein translocase subunit SecD [Isoptericola variabilis]AEG44403.1 protein-export membrane protein SecD [Isoptericola variabilis 225]TWH34396.1 preprotein translocase subunit SecD [Isoptericola variabilis J7]